METMDPLVGLEHRLQISLHRIEPDPKFVSVLQRRLTTTPAVTIERESRMRAFLVVSMGLFGGTLLMWLLRRFWLWVR
jgi:hypothetical protein